MPAAWGMDQEIPDYDMDSEDEHWLNKQTKKMEVSPLKFENMMDRLEKGSGQTVSTVEPVLRDHPFCPGKALSQDRRSLITGGLS